MDGGAETHPALSAPTRRKTDLWVMMGRQSTFAGNKLWTGRGCRRPLLGTFQQSRTPVAGWTCDWPRRTAMSLKMGTREVNGVMVIDLSGRLTMGEASASLRAEVQDEIGHGSLKILLNLADVSYIDSAGLGELTSAFTSVRNRNGNLKLLNLTKRVHDLMQITKLYTVFDVYDDERQAIASFNA
jgi:anti-sigma B factor antagonist